MQSGRKYEHRKVDVCRLKRWRILDDDDRLED